MTSESAPAEHSDRETEFCGCANCESEIVAALVVHPSVSLPEATRWVLASHFAGAPRLRCAR
jgi:hypothetical protein